MKFEIGTFVRNRYTKELLKLVKPGEESDVYGVKWLVKKESKETATYLEKVLELAEEGACFEDSIANHRRKSEELARSKGYAMHVPLLFKELTGKEEHYMELLKLLFKEGARLYMTAPPSVVEEKSIEMGNHVMPIAKESTHGLKCNIAVSNSYELGSLQKLLGINVHTNGWTNAFSEVEICSKQLALDLGKMGVKSETKMGVSYSQIEEGL